MEYIFAFLFAIVGISYFISGMVFSTVWSRLFNLIDGDTKVMISEEVLLSIDNLGNKILPEVNPVLSYLVKSNICRGLWMIFIGLLLTFTVIMLLLNIWIGMALVIAFSLLEICLGIFFYWKRYGYKKGLQYIVVFSILIIITILGIIFL